MRRLAEAGSDDPGGLRQLRAQRHGVPVRGRRRRRGLRRHALCRGPHAPPSPSPAVLDPAPQVQDRLRGMRRRPRADRDQRHRLAGTPAWEKRLRAARVPRDGRGRHLDPVRIGRLLYDFLPAAEMLKVAEAVLRVFHRLGDYKHKQRNRMKFLIRAHGLAGLARRVRACARGRTCRGRPAAAVHRQTPPRRRLRPTGSAASAPSVSVARRHARRARCVGLASARAAARHARFERSPGPLGAQQREGSEAGGLLGGGRHAASGRRDGRPVAPARRSGPCLRRRHRARHPRPGPPVALGADERGAGALPPPGGGRSRARRRGHGRGRDELPRGGGVPSRGHPVARSRPASRRSPARAPGPRGRGGRSPHQDQRLPQRLRPASHRGRRLPGQRAPAGRSA